MQCCLKHSLLAHHSQEQLQGVLSAGLTAGVLVERAAPGVVAPAGAVYTGPLSGPAARVPIFDRTTLSQSVSAGKLAAGAVAPARINGEMSLESAGAGCGRQQCICTMHCRAVAVPAADNVQHLQTSGGMGTTRRTLVLFDVDTTTWHEYTCDNCR